MEDKLIRLPEACERLGIKKTKLYELLKAGKISSGKEYGCRLISSNSIDAHIASILKEGK